MAGATFGKIARSDWLLCGLESSYLGTANTNLLLTEFARDRTWRISALGLSCARSVLSRPWADILARTRSIRCIYCTTTIVQWSNN